MPTVHLQDLVNVRPGHLEGDEHHYHELVARRRNQVRRRAQPVRELAVAGRGDPVPLPRALALSVVALDEAVPFETLERRVDLADVERPDVAGPGLELALQP